MLEGLDGHWKARASAFRKVSTLKAAETDLWKRLDAETSHRSSTVDKNVAANKERELWNKIRTLEYQLGEAETKVCPPVEAPRGPSDGPCGSPVRPYQRRECSSRRSRYSFPSFRPPFCSPNISKVVAFTPCFTTCSMRPEGGPLGKRPSPVSRGAALCRCPGGKPKGIVGAPEKLEK